MKRPIICLIVVFAGLIAGCSQEEGTPVIARVGDSRLTLQDIEESVPPEYLPFMTQQQYKDYVQRWVDSEVLLAEAVKRKIDRDPAALRQLERIRREVLAAQLISQACPPSGDVSDLQIQRYYEQHQNEFVRSQWELKSLHLLVLDNRLAWTLRQQITPDNFLALARQHSIDPVDDPEKAAYKTAGEMLPELAGVLMGIRVGGITNPIQTPHGSYIVQLLDKQPPKSVRPLSEVREEIANRLTAEEQKKDVANLISTLKSGLVVEMNLRQIPGLDSAHSGARTVLP